MHKKMSPTLLNSFPEKIETDRLIIRVAKPGDGAVFNAAIVSSLDVLSPWLAWVSPSPSVEESELSCRRAYARFLLNEDLMAFFFLKDSETLVGGSGLHNPDWKTRKFEVGYWCRRGYGGRGLITEGVSALTNYAFGSLRASRVFLTCDDLNTKSWQLAERAGYQLEGLMVNERFNLQGKLRNTRIYARITEA
jgi:RimJ/RimL family protein N-acetyltransferase